MKTCVRCKKIKDLSEFRKRNKDTEVRISYCHECWKDYSREHYRTKGRQYYLDSNKDRRKRNRQFVFNYLKTHPCEECGENRIATLQFDHIDLKTKDFTIGKKAHISSLEKIKKEIAKCRVLCANCHAVHTANQFGWYKDLE